MQYHAKSGSILFNFTIEKEDEETFRMEMSALLNELGK